MEGQYDTVPIEAVPKKVIETALRATNLIGSGLYGVDIKEIDGKQYVIEVNDNPNIDFNIEDQALKDDLYRRIIQSFKNRLEKKAFGKNGN